MEKAVDVLKREFSGLRTGRASTSLLDPISVEAYGSKVPLNQVSNISVPESRLLIVQVWDDSLVNTVENSIRNSNLGLNPMIEGSLIRIPIPELSEERRIEIVKIASKYSEDSKVSIRNIRREANEDLKKLLKLKEISEDDEKIHEKKVQNITDEHIKSVDNKVLLKEKEIMTIWTILIM